jgi:hypothetical protein
MGYPTVYPTGVTIYDPEKAWSGYTVMPIEPIGSLVIDMNGNEVPAKPLAAPPHGTLRPHADAVFSSGAKLFYGALPSRAKPPSRYAPP